MRLEISQKNLLDSKLSLQRLVGSSDISLIEQLNTNGWTIDSPGTFVVDPDQYLLATAFSLRFINSTTQNIVIRATQSSIIYPYSVEKLIFHAMMFPEEDVIASVYLHLSGTLHTSVIPNIQEIPAGKWSPVFSNEQSFDNSGNSLTGAVSATITIVIETTSPDRPIYFTLPTLTLNEPENYNQFSLLSKPLFPDVFRDVDSESTNPVRPLAKMYHSMSTDLSQAMDKYVRMSNYDREELGHASADLDGDPFNTLTRSELTDPELMTPEYLEWGAMLRGAQTLADIQVNNVSVLPDNFDFRRWQVRTAAFGHNAGSRESVKNTVKNVLTGAQKVLVTPLWQGATFNIMIRTLNSETPGNLTVGATSPTVLAVAEQTRPAGFTFVHNTVNAINFILNDPDFGVFNQSDLE